LAFRDCNNLQLITNLNPIPLAISSNVFEGVNQSDCILEVPASAVAAYQNAEVWKEFSIVGITGIDELQIANCELRIYPNPATSVCYIVIPEEFQHEQTLTVSVYDPAGVLVQQIQAPNRDEDFNIKIDQKAQGVYLAVLSNGKKSYKGRVMFM